MIRRWVYALWMANALWGIAVTVSLGALTARESAMVVMAYVAYQVAVLTFVALRADDAELEIRDNELDVWRNQGGWLGYDDRDDEGRP